MYIIVGGAGKVGYFLAKQLVSEDHEVLVIEKDKKRCITIADELGSIVLHGDACETTTLQEAGTERADVVVAATGDDEDNLVICQMAKLKFKVRRTIARINNPKNEGIFRSLGIDVTVSTTDLILAHISQELPSGHLVHLLRLRHSDLEIVEAKLTADANAVRKALKDLNIPPSCRVSAIVRNGKMIVPDGDYILQEGDEVIAVCSIEGEPALRRILEGTR
ncbi:MAG: TrkA family potassium uptake protein [Chloroflexi bacterium]|nr:TrkA family potassium uptake protein [Chloroflexota bacterium]